MKRGWLAGWLALFKGREENYVWRVKQVHGGT